MPFKSIFTFLLFFIFSQSFSQDLNFFSGKITAELKPLSDITVELKINDISKFAISNSKGEYKFLKLKVIDTDSITIMVRQLGYKFYTRKLAIKSENTIFDIILELENSELKEVIVQSEKITNTAKKSIYKINQKDFIPNTKAPEVLATIPNINFINDVITVEGTLGATVFINGIQSFKGELNTIDATSISKVEILSNPSSAFGTDNLNAIINIITKKEKQEFIKGAIGSTYGVRNESGAINPYFSLKLGKVTCKSYFESKTNKQLINYSINRLDNNSNFYQQNNNTSKNKQLYFNNKLNVLLSKKWDITLLGGIYGYKFDNNSKGFSFVNNTNQLDFTKIGFTSNKEWDINSVTRNKITDTKTFFIKTKYSNYEDNNENTFFTNTSSSNFIVNSRNKEATVAVDYENSAISLFKKETELYTGSKFINRSFDFSNANLSIEQNIFNLYSELDTSWSDKFSTEFSITYENATNSNNELNSSYNILLPTVNSIIHYKNKLDLKLGYSRKIIRPDADELNNSILIIYPGIARQGNYQLEPEKRNYTFISLIKAFKKGIASIKIYNESVNNAIVETYRNQDNLVIKTLNNAAKNDAYGFNLGYSTKLLNKVNINVNSGMQYDTFEDTNPNSLIKKNKGYSFRSNVNANTKIFKDKISLSFSARNNNPTYSLLSKRTTYPYLDFTAVTNVFKNKLNLNLYIKDILNKSSNSIERSNYEGFNQSINIKNQTFNIMLAITYNFGKNFNDNIEDNSIFNDDVRK